MAQKQLYSIGSQTFSELQERGCVYVDKTGLIYQLTHEASKYIFLSRPRRFGKSLLVSTLREYFEGNREMFRGLAIEQLEKDWTQHPVVHLSMSQGKHMSPEELNSYLLDIMERNETRFGFSSSKPAPNLRLCDLVEHLHHSTGQKVVVLIDEYDAPLLDVMYEDEELPKLRKVMRNFYAPLKDLDPHLRFVFLTGITKFSQVSIFSELNNISNVSMLPKYAALCGITEQEMIDYMRPGIELLAEEQEMSYDETLAALKQQYDGYHFTWPSPDLYNPYSLLRALDVCDISNYWFDTGTPTVLIEAMRKYGVAPDGLAVERIRANEFDRPTESISGITPLLYQSGYLTIKSYDRRRREYSLDIPNEEVRNGLMENLLTEYITLNHKNAALRVTTDIRLALWGGDVDEALRVLQEFLRTCQYTDRPLDEAHYQSVLYMIFALAGVSDVCIEERTYRGRIDIVARTPQANYIMELKMDEPAEMALAQIDVKDYAARFALDPKPIIKVGIGFSTAERGITGWVVQPVDGAQ